jgi:hypothetical protein
MRDVPRGWRVARRANRLDVMVIARAARWLCWIALALSGCTSWAAIQRTVPRATQLPIAGYSTVYVEAAAGEVMDRIATAIRDRLEGDGVRVVRVAMALGALEAGSAVLTVEYHEVDRRDSSVVPSASGWNGESRLSFQSTVVAGIRMSLRDGPTARVLGTIQVSDEAQGLQPPPPLPSGYSGSVPVFYQSEPPRDVAPTAMDVAALVGRLIDAALASMHAETGVDDVELDGEGAAHDAVALALSGRAHEARLALERLVAGSASTPREHARLLFDVGQLRRLDVDASAADPDAEVQARLRSAEEALVASSAAYDDAHTTRALAQVRAEQAAREQEREIRTLRTTP